MDSLIVGLTGNICTGKSTLAQLFSKYDNVKVLNCDLIARNILLNDGWDLDKISNTLFKNTEYTNIFKNAFEEYLFPKVWNDITATIESFDHYNDLIFIIESALIFETLWDLKLDAVILTHCTKETQLERMKLRCNNDDEKLLKLQERMKFQWDSLDKLRQASCSVHTTYKNSSDEVGEIMNLLEQKLKYKNHREEKQKCQKK